MSSTTTIAIAGISSRLALGVVASLLQRPNVTIRGSCRDSSKLPASLRNDPRVSIIQTGPYDKDALRGLLKSADVAMCTYFADNQTMLEGQKLLIDLCEEEGVMRYIASDYTTDYTKLDWGDIEFKDPMKHVKAYLETKKRVKGVHVLIGLLLDMNLDWLELWDAKTKTLRYWGTGHEKWEFTTYRTAAEYVAAVAMDPSAVGVLKFLGDRKSMFEIADIMESVYGFKPALESRGSLKDLAQRRESSGQQHPANAVAYFMLTGRIYLGNHLENQSYPGIGPENVQAFFERENISHSVH